MYQYPYGNAQQLNLDWILGKIQELESGSGGTADIKEIANALIAASYAVQNYNRSDIVFYNDKLYRANQNITAEPWNAAHWDEILLGDTVANLVRYVGNLDNSQVFNSSTVAGTHTSDALDTLYSALTNIGSFTTAAITTQVDALGSGEYVGTVVGSTTGLPVATSGVILAIVYNTNFKRIFYYPNGGADLAYVLAKSGGTWQSTWTLLPSRNEVDGKVPTTTTVNGKALNTNITLNASNIPNDSTVTGTNVDDALDTLNTTLTNVLNDITPIEITAIVKEEENTTLNSKNVYKLGRLGIIFFNFTTSTSLATNTNLFSGLPGAISAWTFIGDWPEQNQESSFYVTNGGYLRNSGTLAAGHWVIAGTYITAN